MSSAAKRKRNEEDVTVTGQLRGLGFNYTEIKRLRGFFGDGSFTTRTVGHNAKGLDEQFYSLAQTLELRVDGKIFKWETYSPQLLLSFLLERSERLADSYAAALGASPPSRESPWNLIVVFDEFVPGNKANLDNRRKELTIAFSFAELGMSVLDKVSSWLVPAVLRSKVLSTCDGGASNCLRLVLRQLLCDRPHGFEHGYPVTIHNTHHIIYARLFVLLSDSDGLRMALDWRGFNSIRPCLKCNNVFNLDTDLDVRVGGVEIDCCDSTVFIGRTEEELCHDIDTTLDAEERYSHDLLSKARFDKILKAIGFNPNPLGVLADKDLRRRIEWLKVLCHDWMHGYLSDGTLVQEVLGLVKAASAADENFPYDVEAFLSAEGWCFPQHVESKMRYLHRIFDHWRMPNKEAEKIVKIRADASEMLGLYALLRHFIELFSGQFEELVGAQMASFHACCAVIEYILSIKRGLVDAASPAVAERLRSLQRAHMELHVRAYGSAFVKPKFHLNTHVPDQLEIMMALYDAFTIEKIHLIVKECADPVRNTTSFERSVLRDVVHVQLAQLDRSTRDGPTGKILQRGDGFQISRAASVDGLSFCAGDVVRRGDEAGLVMACCSELGALNATVILLAPTGVGTPHSAHYLDSGRATQWSLGELRHVVAWYKRGEELVVVE